MARSPKQLANLKPFTKNDPRINRKGGSKWLTTRLEEALREKAKGNADPYYEMLIKRELNNAIVKGDQRAIEHIWDRVEGKVSQPLSGDPNNPLVIEISEAVAKKHAAHARPDKHS